MDIIDPERLRDIRVARGRSQKSLGHASETSARQIVRIEKANGPVKVRKATIDRLANTLEVSRDVLAGTVPVPEGLQLAFVDPRALTATRRRRGWSRQRLSEASGVPDHRIRTVEKAAEKVSVPPRDATRLAQALAVKETELSGEEPLGDLPPQPADVGVSLKTAPALRLAYDLVERRYGATSRDLFVLAPLLFVLLAEGSLASRRKKLEKAERAFDDLEEMAKDNPTLYFGKRQSVVRQGISEEQASIDAADVLGRRVRDSDWAVVHGFSEDDTNITPFADYLEELAKDLDKPHLVNFDSLLLADQGLDPWGANPYEVCGSELRKVAGMSQEALAALQWGDARLAEIPEEMMVEGAWEERRGWLEDKLSEDARKYTEWVYWVREQDKRYQEDQEDEEEALRAGDKGALEREQERQREYEMPERAGATR